MVSTLINPTSLDFNEIKTAFKDFLSTKSTYQDFSFEGSNLSILLDMLSYNTHIGALNAYINFNETNLESAQIRGNVVTKSASLGYKPRSKIASKAYVDIIINNPVGTNQSLTLPKGTRLTTTINNTQYPFVVSNTYSSNKSLDGKFRFSNVEILQGILKNNFYIYDDRDMYPTFTIPDVNIDTNTIVVSVKEHDSAVESVLYSRYTNFSQISPTSQIYYIDENYDGLFYLTFGDNVIGKKLINNNIISVQFISTKGVECNGAKIFTISEAIGGNNDISVNTLTPSFGGLDKEDIETVRYNSTRYFASQDRAVTETDYSAIISNQFDDIETITVYGGETLQKPRYGKVFISIKPYNRDLLSNSEKSEILNKILRPKQVGTITPQIIDPDYTYISMKVNFKYNSNRTALSVLELNNIVKNKILDYNNSSLQKFSGVFRHSNVVALVDNSNISITSNIINTSMYKEVTPKNNTKNYFELTFTNPSFSTSGNDFTVTSSPIVINGVSYFLGDKPTEYPDTRQLFIYRKVNDVIQVIIGNVGTLSQSQGYMILKDFIPDTTDVIKVYVKPNSMDLSPRYNQLLKIKAEEIFVNGEVDASVIGGSLGAISYTTTPIGSF